MGSPRSSRNTTSALRRALHRLGGLAALPSGLRRPALSYSETSTLSSLLDPGWMAKLLSKEIGGTIWLAGSCSYFLAVLFDREPDSGLAATGFQHPADNLDIAHVRGYPFKG